MSEPADAASEVPRGVRQDLIQVARGVLMGGADVVPGVSGGTMALIVGIYERLVTAISHVDLQLFGHVLKGRWAEVARYVDLRFLVTLLVGIGLGIVTLGGVVNSLLTTPSTRSATLAAFLGMIVASCVLVAGWIPRRTGADVAVALVLGAAGVAFAWWLTGLPTSTAEPTLAYVFTCGVIAICAMILPGLSGAYLLLILGLYLHLTDIVKRLPRLDISVEDAVTVGVFMAGAAIGIVGFSKVLRRLLARWPGPTMAVLCGFMVGALRKVWPFQIDTTPAEHELKHKVYVNVVPESIDGDVLIAVVVAVVAMAAVFAIDRVAGKERAAH